MKKIYSSVQNSISPTVNKVIGENGDTQFTSTGSGIVDLISNGADKFLQKEHIDSVKRFSTLVENAFKENPTMTKKIARYFLDQENGQGLKEQTPLLIAVLNDRLSYDDVMKILTINPTGFDGAIEPSNVDYLTLVRILAWHHYLNGKSSKLGFGTCRAFAEIIHKDPNALAKIYQIRSKNIAYDSKNNFQVGIIDILGITRNFAFPVMPETIKQEYENYLWPRYRNQKYATKPFTAYGKKIRQFFKNELPSGEVPHGVSFTQVLSTGNKAAIRKMMTDGRLSNTQIKLNLNTAIELLTNDEINSLVEKRNFNLFPHEIYALGLAFGKGTANTQPNPKGIEIANNMLAKMVKEYKANKGLKNVLFLGDTSGSMYPKLSEKSSVSRAEFSAFMSYFSGLVCPHGTFGIWDNSAHLYRVGNKVEIESFYKNIQPSNANTNVVNAIKTTADFFSNSKHIAPETICLISDMQFDQATSEYDYINNKRTSVSIQVALDYYKEKIGFIPSMVFWNVAAPTVPSAEEKGVMMISGFSANTLGMILGIQETNTTKEKTLERKDVVELINNIYK